MTTKEEIAAYHHGHPNKDTNLHICHVDTSKLDNGAASIVELGHRYKGKTREAMIDKSGYFRDVWDTQYYHRDHWELK